MPGWLSWVRKHVAKVLMPTEPAPAGGNNVADKSTTTDGALNTQRWQEATDKLRSRVDLTAKALGGIGTTVASAIGIAKIGDLFPIPPGWPSWVWAVTAIAGFIAIASAILIVTSRLWKVNQPILMRTDSEAMKAQGDVDEKERQEVQLVYQQMADLNLVRSLRAYEARGHRRSRVAARTADEKKREKLEREATQIYREIQETFARAALRIIRRRTTNAIRGKGSRWAYVLLVAGVLGFALGTDYVSSERSERITIAKSCADAREAGANADTLPEICGEDPPADDPAKNSPAQEQAKAVAALSEPLQRCLALIDAGKAKAGSCNVIADAMAELVTDGDEPR
jgi:hypothetical protein